jgi:hypothetical protein
MWTYSEAGRLSGGGQPQPVDRGSLRQPVMLAISHQRFFYVDRFFLRLL